MTFIQFDLLRYILSDLQLWQLNTFDYTPPEISEYMREYLVTVYKHTTYLARTLWLNRGGAAYSPRFEIQMKYQNWNEGLLAYHHYILRCSLVAQRLKCLPAMQETRVGSLGREDPLEKEIKTHSSTLAWRISWTEEPGRIQFTGSQRVGTRLSHFTLLYTGEEMSFGANHKRQRPYIKKLLKG